MKHALRIFFILTILALGWSGTAFAQETTCPQSNRPEGCECIVGAHCASGECSPQGTCADSANIGEIHAVCRNNSCTTEPCIEDCSNECSTNADCNPVNDNPNQPPDGGNPPGNPTDGSPVIPADDTLFSCKNPIVPCGRPGTPLCDLCYLYKLAGNVVNFCLFCLILPVSVIALLIGGIFLLASRGNPQMIELGKNALFNVVIGVIFAFAAWLIIATIINTLGYKGFTAAWNIPPTCVATPINEQPGTSIPGGPSSPAPPMACLAEEIGSTRACKVGSCDGTQTCASAENNTQFWSACNQTDPSCRPGGGTCPAMDTGPCSVSSLSASCFGNLGSEASQICRGESSGNRKAHGDPITGNGITVFRSIGLFQINLSAHSIAGLNCPNAFEGENKPLKPTPEARALYDRCVSAAEDAGTNIAKACEIRSARGSWRDWTVAGSCNLL